LLLFDTIEKDFIKRKEPTEPPSKKLKVTCPSGKQSNLSSFFKGV
jgi:hypothetical protein